MNKKILSSIGILMLANTVFANTYKIVDTNQKTFFNNKTAIEKPEEGEVFYNQDANYPKNQMSYKDNGDNTITDNITDLMWEKSYRVLSLKDAKLEVEKLNSENYLGHNDWRLPSIKEVYSLMDFSGIDPSAKTMDTIATKAFIDTDYFDFEYGSNGSRPIDTQILSSTIYTGYTMNGDETVFGLNVADGRIKGYPVFKKRENEDNKFTMRYVRGNKKYGINDFVDNGNQTITDKATNLMWDKNDSGKGMNWKEALQYATQMNKENYLGYSDWRVPNAKELHSILDYDNSPQKNDKASIDDKFNITKISYGDDKLDYPYFWTSTTHKSMKGNGNAAVYIVFGQGWGYFGRRKTKPLIDVHGAGSQRSDPKVGDASKFPQGRGPQGDLIVIDNFVRLVRDTES